MDKTREKALAKIAAEIFGFDSTMATGRDSLDFHDIHINELMKALRYAYTAGQNSTSKR